MKRESKLYETEIFNASKTRPETPNPSEIARIARVDRNTVINVQQGKDARISTIKKVARARGYMARVVFEPLEARQ